MEEHGDEESPHEVGARIARRVDELRTLLGGLAEERGCAHPGSPGALAVPERRVERMAELLAAERIVLEERQLPAVERIAELRILVCEREHRPQLLRDRRRER